MIVLLYIINIYLCMVIYKNVHHKLATFVPSFEIEAQTLKSRPH